MQWQAESAGDRLRHFGPHPDKIAAPSLPLAKLGHRIMPLHHFAPFHPLLGLTIQDISEGKRRRPVRAVHKAQTGRRD